MIIKWLFLLPLLCLVYLTNFKGEADYKVYLTNFKGEDMAGGMFSTCGATDSKGSATYVVYLTQFKGEADLVVYNGDFL